MFMQQRFLNIRIGLRQFRLAAAKEFMTNRFHHGDMATEAVVLNTGTKMPILGVGTFLVQDREECKGAIRAALDAGYRHIDTAFIYQNEAFIGEVLQEYVKAGKLRREDVFVTSKLWLTYAERERVHLCLEKSLKDLQLEYVDMYLIHFPIPLRDTDKTEGGIFPVDENGQMAFNNDVKIEDTWRGMQDVAKTGQAKAIGVSNFSIQQMERMEKLGGIKPATNQVECHLYLQQNKLFDYLKTHGITMTAFAPIGAPGFPFRELDKPRVLDNPVAKELATKYRKSAAQILLRHLVQKGIIVIPKSTNPQRLRENIAVFDFKLTDEEMKRLNKEDKHLRYFLLELGIASPEHQFD